MRTADVVGSAPQWRWLIQHGRDTPVCPLCLLGDDSAGVPRYRRNDWNLAWLTRCLQHNVPLVRLPGWPTAPLHDWQRRRHRRNASDMPVRYGQNPGTALRRRKRSIRIAKAAVSEIEHAVYSAIGGRKPKAAHWGDLSASDFLAVVDNVSSFVVTQFSQSPALCTTDLNKFVDDAPVRFFARAISPASRSTESYGVATLGTIGDVGRRRCALFWTRELMHIHAARPWLPTNLRQSRIRRLAQALNRLPIDAQGWLAHRSLNWPDQYRQIWWADMKSVR